MSKVNYVNLRLYPAEITHHEELRKKHRILGKGKKKLDWICFLLDIALKAVDEMGIDKALEINWAEKKNGS